MRRITMAAVAHVDAGKTTLSENMLYLSGTIRKQGRVDNQDTFLDNHELERQRGITIFSKQAVMKFNDCEITLLDTPGHADFAAEMERTLQVVDMAVLVISGTDGIQSSTIILWKLLARYKVPVYIFINKMDQIGTDRNKLTHELRREFGAGCIDFSSIGDDEFNENIALCDENVLEQYIEEGKIDKGSIIDLISARKVFPCYFGSALKQYGVQELLEGITLYTKTPLYKDRFGARVYKITRDSSGNRLTMLKITGGSLKVKDIITGGDNSLEGEKVDQIRIYSGEKYETTKEAEAGTVCAVTGLQRTYPGEGIGSEAGTILPVLEPVLTYKINLPEGCEANSIIPKLRQLEEEEPELHIVWNEKLQELHVKLMGEVQVEILQSIISKRFNCDVSFGEGSIIYKETIKSPVIGIGHFEPLKHYAEVHLLLEPGEQGSGMVFTSQCDLNMLERSWQRLILTHLEEKEHIGVLTGSPITDMKITLVAGRAHLKHTEGGDFRQATYRAVRQGLMKAEVVLLEPWYEYSLEIPQVLVGRALSDIDRMHGTANLVNQENNRALLTGYCPVSEMRDYQMQVADYTSGLGLFSCTLKDYRPCHNAEMVTAQCEYNPERDTANPGSSVFCSHGAGFLVSWDKVEDYAHIDYSGEILKDNETEDIISDTPMSNQAKDDPEPGNDNMPDADSEKCAAKRTEKTNRVMTSGSKGEYGKEDRELEEIFIRTYGTGKREIKDLLNSRNARINKRPQRTLADRDISDKSGDRRAAELKAAEGIQKQEYLLVDAYNIIFSWEELKALASINMEGARTKLMDILCNYQGFKKCDVILVFDAYKVEGHVCEITDYHNIKVVYTQEAETADRYIEKTAHEIGRRYDVTVATSDALEQIIVMGQGCKRLSANDLYEEIERTNSIIRSEYLEKQRGSRNYMLNNISAELADYIERIQTEDK